MIQTRRFNAKEILMGIFIGTKILEGRGSRAKERKELHISQSLNIAFSSEANLSQELLRHESHQINLFT